MRLFAAFIVVFGVLLSPSMAANPDERLSDPQLEERARIISKNLRCMVCQNQSIDESDAPLAADMRKLVRTRLKEGDSNAEVIDYMQERYGDYVLLKPPVQANTYILWFLPFLLLIGALGWFLRASRRTGADS